MYFWMYVFCFEGILNYIKMFDNYHVLAVYYFNSCNVL